MSETITLTAADDHVLTAWRAGGVEARAGIVIVQEIFGVTDHPVGPEQVELNRFSVALAQ